MLETWWQRGAAARRGVSRKTQDMLFTRIHSSQLIYNSCWEDPRVDRQWLDLDSDSHVVMLTSAGCNVLDYLLDAPAAIHAVDVNFRQNALLELKRALIAQGDYSRLFAMFGNGACSEYQQHYHAVRAHLPAYAQRFWDSKISYFAPKPLRPSLYYRGAAGAMAWFFTGFLKRYNKALSQQVSLFFETESLEQQQQRYAQLEPELWSIFAQWLLQHPLAASMLGIPRAQRRMVNDLYPGGVVQYLRDSAQHVFRYLPIQDNYFWRVYWFGSYTAQCAPNYLKAEHFATLRQHLDRVHVYSTSLTAFLRDHPGCYSHFVLLDHQDWLAWHHPQALAEEWQMILQNSRPGSKILWRSASQSSDFIPAEVRAQLRFDHARSDVLHRQDRVGTYGSLHLAERR